MNIVTIEDLRVGDVLHCKGIGPISSLISFFTKSDITHTAINLENWYILHVGEAHNKKGVISTPLKKWIEVNNFKEIIVSRPLNFDYKEINIRATEKMGWVNYPLWKMIWIYIVHYFTGKWAKMDENVLWCTMFVIHVLKLDLEWSSPVDLYDYLKNNPLYLHFKLIK